MEGKVEAVLPRKKSSFPADATVMASSSSASPAAIFAFLAPLLSLLRHVATLCAGYLCLVGGLKPSAPAPAPGSGSSSSSAAAVASQRDEVETAASEDCTEMVLEVRPREFKRNYQASNGVFRPPTARNIIRESREVARGGPGN